MLKERFTKKWKLRHYLLTLVLMESFLGRFHTYSLFALVQIREQLVTMLHITSSLDCVHTAAFTSGPKCVMSEEAALQFVWISKTRQQFSWIQHRADRKSSTETTTLWHLVTFQNKTIYVDTRAQITKKDPSVGNTSCCCFYNTIL